MHYIISRLTYLLTCWPCFVSFTWPSFPSPRWRSRQPPSPSWWHRDIHLVYQRPAGYDYHELGHCVDDPFLPADPRSSLTIECHYRRPSYCPSSCTSSSAGTEHQLTAHTCTMPDRRNWASECPDVKNYKWPLNPVWHRMLCGCTHMTTVGVKGLTPDYEPSKQRPR